MELFGYHRDDDPGEEHGTGSRIFVDECRLFFASDRLAFANTYAKMGLLNSDPDQLNRFARTMSSNAHKPTGEDFAGLPPTTAT